MISNPKHIQEDFKLNGESYSRETLVLKANDFINNGRSFEISIGSFLLNWLDEKDTIEVKTSGSTGRPKLMVLRKKAMINSALATRDFFKLKQGDTALHCLPTDFIAGKMMLVRALVIGLDIDCIAPSASPEIDLNRHYDFCAMIPLQLQNSLSKCTNVKTLIVGGAPMSMRLKKSVQSLKTKVFETYGMTETITHIAVKQINNSSKEITTSNYFELLPGVSMCQDHRNCLVIHAPKIAEDPIVTNDIVTMKSSSLFEWIGRMDTIINSGGIKISPEHIESKLESHISKRFFIASKADESLGEKLILVLESESNTLNPEIFNSLEKHQRPKEIYVVSKFAETSTGKIQRKKTLATLNL